MRFLRALWSSWSDIRLSARLLRDPGVPLWAKGTLPLSFLYLISPIDVLPDAIIGLGEIDDLVVLYAGLRLFLFLCPAAVVAFHRAALASRRGYSPMPPSDVVIDAEFRRDA